MPLRVAFDLDGVLADFARAYREVEMRLFGSEADGASTPEPDPSSVNAPAPAGVESARALDAARERRRRVWEAIESTPDFWRTLTPLEPGALLRLEELAQRHRWDIVFVTHRPPTLGASVQLQSQRWLIEQGFSLPSVLVLQRSRGHLARALSLDFLVDDLPRHCLDILADSETRPVLMVRDGDRVRTESGRRLDIPVVASVAECLALFEEEEARRARPGMLGRLSRFLKGPSRP